MLVTTLNVLNREEELMYLEFISAVTEDILSRGHISDRFVDISLHYVDDIPLVATACIL